MTTAREALRDWHDRLGSMIDQVGHPEYSLREFIAGLRVMRDEMLALRSSVQEEPDTHPIHLTEDAYYELLGYRADCLLRKSKEEPAAGAVAEKCAEIAESVPRDGARCAQLMLCEQAWDEGQEHAAKAIRAYASTLPQSAQNNAEVEGERK